MAKKYWKSQGILSVQKSRNLGLSTGGGGIPACIAVVSQHALQQGVSRPTPGKEGGGVYAVKCVCWKSQGILSVQKSGNPGLSTGWGGGGGIPACIAGGIPACLAAGGSPGPHLGGGVCIPACTEADPPVDGYCCGQYTSYWNAFFL